QDNFFSASRGEQSVRQRERGANIREGSGSSQDIFLWSAEGSRVFDRERGESNREGSGSSQAVCWCSTRTQDVQFHQDIQFREAKKKAQGRGAEARERGRGGARCRVRT
ncbi:unnamed protein product, partial [Pylaiella littoralis]